MQPGVRAIGGIMAPDPANKTQALDFANYFVLCRYVACGSPDTTRGFWAPRLRCIPCVGFSYLSCFERMIFPQYNNCPPICSEFETCAL